MASSSLLAKFSMWKHKHDTTSQLCQRRVLHSAIRSKKLRWPISIIDRWIGESTGSNSPKSDTNADLVGCALDNYNWYRNQLLLGFSLLLISDPAQPIVSSTRPRHQFGSRTLRSWTRPDPATQLSLYPELWFLSARRLKIPYDLSYWCLITDLTLYFTFTLDDIKTTIRSWKRQKSHDLWQDI